MANYPTSLDTWADKTDNVDTVYASDVNQPNNAVVALETKLGTGASTPTSGKFMVGTGTGVSGWGDVPSGTVIESPILRGFGGWQEANETWTYSSADGSTALYTVSGDVRTKYSPGMRVKYTQDQALSHYWTFNTNSTPDVGSATMADIGTPTYSAGKFGNALTLNGTNQALSIADAAAFKPTGEFTFGCWFKTSNTGTGKTLFQSFAGLTNYAGIDFGINSSNKLYTSTYKNTGTTAGSDFTQITGTTTVTDGNFHYAVVCFRNNFLRLYLDGNLEASGYALTPAYQATNYVRIGCQNLTGSNVSWMNGQIDDLFLINGYALDEKTIKAKYDAGTAQGTGNITIQKYGIVSAETTYSAPNSTVTIWGGTDYSTANSTISSPYFSHEKAPFGFPLNPVKWTVEVSDTTIRSQLNPTVNVWYNLGTLSIVVPIGVWRTQFFCDIQWNGSSNNTFQDSIVTLSTANNSESDPDFSGHVTTLALASLSTSSSCFINREKTISLMTKTTLYLNSRITNNVTGTLYNRNDMSKLIIRAVSAYL